jgi:hypothetical protein
MKRLSVCILKVRAFFARSKLLIYINLSFSKEGIKKGRVISQYKGLVYTPARWCEMMDLLKEYQTSTSIAEYFNMTMVRSSDEK